MTPERLNKYLAHAGVGSRRHCDELIAAGRVKLNGEPVTDLGTKVDPSRQKVTVDDEPVRAERLVYWAVHKPPGYLCTSEDPAGRPVALELVPHIEQRVYTVGRLDEASEGLLLLTNDGELAYALMHPRYGVDKTYQVLVAGKPSREDLQKLLDGVWISDGKARAKAVRRMKPQGDGTWLRITLSEGKNREIRRVLAKLGHKVMRLKRVAIGPVELDRLKKGKSRKLGAAEVERLKRAATGGKLRVERAAAAAAGEAPPAEERPAKRGAGRGAAPRPERPKGVRGAAVGRAGPRGDARGSRR